MFVFHQISHLIFNSYLVRLGGSYQSWILLILDLQIFGKSRCISKLEGTCNPSDRF